MSLISTSTHIPRMIVLVGELQQVEINVNAADTTITACLLESQTSEFQTLRSMQPPRLMNVSVSRSQM